ncbi:hypothetical protein OIE68_39145 [Nocardia vinacea]|uniref:hypothetical protein n=1 Tax=Nocardia vinacea TaxID=96468 RepID=UPI002E109600|nr:hypothetical protein OIE68_39145 [Nocardia vinacea]
MRVLRWAAVILAALFLSGVGIPSHAAAQTYYGGYRIDFLADGYGLDPDATAILDSTEVWTVGYPTSGTSMDQAYGALGVAALVMEIGPRDADCAGFFPEYSCVDRLLWPQIRQAFSAAAWAAAAPYRQ